ncbi:MAG: hypothetical protein AB1656_22020 [Candidatus Omnitrophota bacterium]
MLDERNRLKGCEMAGVEPGFRYYMGDDPEGFIISSNLYRRHLCESKRGDMAAKFSNMRQGSRTDIPSQNSDEVSIQQAAIFLMLAGVRWLTLNRFVRRRRS